MYKVKMLIIGVSNVKCIIIGAKVRLFSYFCTPKLIKIHKQLIP